jgi:hypothetical protein
LFVEELNVLLSKLVSRGFSYELVLDSGTDSSSSSDDSSSSTTSTTSTRRTSSDDETQGLNDKLRYADALILPLPRAEYTSEELTEIERFVEKGGRVLIIGDPTRTVSVEALNSIAGLFGIIYANDYLYSLEHNDNNYRNVIYSNFKDSPVTRGLSQERKVVFYGGGSLVAPGHEVVLGDNTTYSSTSEGGRAMAAAALTTDDRVLALGDLTFFSEPYSAAEGNGTLITNIADFLTAGRRDFELQDFPYFFNPGVEIVFSNPLVFNSQFVDAVKLKENLERTDRTVTFTDSISETDQGDLIFIGRFEDAPAVQNYLAEAGITIVEAEKQDNQTDVFTTTEDLLTTSNRTAPADDTAPGKEDRYVKGRIQISSVGDLELGGSTIFYLHQEQGRNVLVILSETPDTNADAFELLLENKIDECRISSTVAVCQTQEPDGSLPPSMRSNRIDRVLVVASDTGRTRGYEQTGALEFSSVLSTTYHVDTWVVSESESPDIDQLLEYDAVIWSTGDYWDDSVSEEDAALLSKYIEVGGNLVLAGASIAFDWDHTDFLSHVAHADYISVAEQSDLEVAMPDHPIAEGFAEGSVITFTTNISPTTDEPLEIDVVDRTPDARVIFKRGPGSDEAGEASVIAFEDDRAKVAYYAFPIYLLSEEARGLLINNTLSWFMTKPLELPDESETRDRRTGDSSEGEGGTEEDTGTGEGGEDTGGEGGGNGTDDQTGGDDGSGNGGDGGNGGDDQTGGDDGSGTGDQTGDGEGTDDQTGGGEG